MSESYIEKMKSDWQHIHDERCYAAYAKENFIESFADCTWARRYYDMLWFHKMTDKTAPLKDVLMPFGIKWSDYFINSIGENFDGYRCYLTHDVPMVKSKWVGITQEFIKAYDSCIGDIPMTGISIITDDYNRCKVMVQMDRPSSMVEIGYIKYWI